MASSISPTREGFYALWQSGEGTFATRDDGHALPEDFAKAQALWAGPAPRTPVAPPDWYTAARRGDLSAAAIIGALIERVPHDTSLCEARLIIHELSRELAGAEAVRRLITQDAARQVSVRNP